jgi:hypothetical protein
MPWAGYGDDGESFAFSTVVDYARARRWLLTWAAKGARIPADDNVLPFCSTWPTQRRAVVSYTYLGRGQDHVPTSFATRMLHRPCVARLIARLIAGIRGSTHTVQAGSDGTAVG